MLPAFATVEQLGKRINVESEDNDKAQAALDDASTCVRVEARNTWTDTNGDLVEDIPDIVIVATLRLAARAFANPSGARSQGTDTFQVTWGDEDEYWRQQVRVAGGVSSGLTSQKLHSPIPAMADLEDIDQWLETMNLDGDFES